MSTSPDRPPLRILRMPQVEAKVGLKRTAIYERIQRGEFPRGLKLSKCATGWLEHEIDAYIQAKAEARGDARTEAAPGAHLGATSAHDQRRKQGKPG